LANKYIEQYLPHVDTTGHWLGFIDGYKAAQQRGMFTEEQIKLLWLGKKMVCEEDCKCHTECPKADEYIDSLLPKYEVEMEVHCDAYHQHEEKCLIPVTYQKDNETYLKLKH